MRAKRFISYLAITFVVFTLCGFGVYTFGRSIWFPVYQRVMGGRTVAEVQGEYGPKVRPVWTERFRSRNLSYPPGEVTFVALKDERKLEVWVNGENDSAIRIAEYPVLAASGLLGPKLREGDGQVPEGLYSIEGLNPNSAYHLSMKVNYPNVYDRARAKDDGRTHPGTNIFIHGKRASIGCLAMGDPAIEELFVLVADIGHENTRVIIAPCDLRVGCVPPSSDLAWVPGLYREIQTALAPYMERPE